jgi:hypothetical protein
MSQRHRSDAAPPPKVELRAHAHNERHRVHIELHNVTTQLGSGFEPDEVHEPGRAWVPQHHHDSEKAKARSGRQRKRHWKTKMWKRRTSVRKAKAQAIRLVAEHA